MEKLKRKIALCEKHKEKIMEWLQDSKNKLVKRELSYENYINLLNKKHDGRTPKEWLIYYDKYLVGCERKLKKEKTKSAIKKTALLIIIPLIILLLILTPALQKQKVSLAPSTQKAHTDILNIQTSESLNQNWQPQNTGTLISARISGQIEGHGLVLIYLGDRLILDNSNLQEIQFSPNITKNNFTEEIPTPKEKTEASDKNTTLPDTNITEENTTTATEPPIKETEEGPAPTPIEIPITNFFEHCEETCDLTSANLTADSYNIKIEITGKVTLNLDSITYETENEQVQEKPQKITQTEQKTKEGKKVFISSSQNIKNAVKIKIEESWNIKSQTSLTVKDSLGNEVLFKAIDSNIDGKIDEIEIKPTDSATILEYEVIVITNAEHLSTNREFLSNIFEEVKEKDDIWSETINADEFVRVTFEEQLDSDKDITLYPRVVKGFPRIEVYEKDESKLIAEFTSINNNEYNKIFLTNLVGQQDTFDLKIIGGEIEFDHIIDPSQGFNTPTDNSQPTGTGWTSPTNAYTSDDQYAAGRDGNIHDWKTFNFAIPTGATIQGIEVQLEWKVAKSSDTFKLHAQLTDPTGNLMGAEKTTPQLSGTTEKTDLLGSDSDLWGIPFGTLSEADINSDNFGVRITAEILQGIGQQGGTPSFNSKALLDSVGFKVTYGGGANQPPTIIPGSIITDTDDIVDLNAGGTQVVPVEFTAEDTNGANTLISSTASVSLTKTGETQRDSLPFSCTAGTPSGNQITYTCNVNMEYFDAAGTWTAEVYIEDHLGLPAQETSTFTLNPLLDIELLNTPITFGQVEIGQQYPIAMRIKNNGNVEVPTDRVLQVVSSALGSPTVPDTISSSQFKVAGTPIADACTNGNALDDINPTTLNATLGRGDGVGGNNEETLTFCLQVPNVAESTYSAVDGGGAWTITILAATFTLAGKKNKKIKKGNLIKALSLIAEEIREKYSLNKKEAIEIIIKEIQEKYKLTNKQISEVLESEQETEIPVSIFTKELGGLEALCKYLKENVSMSYHKIALALSRDDSTVWTAYNKAKEKNRAPINGAEKTISIPLGVFKNRELTILETLTSFLREKGMKFREIAELIKRDERNLQAIYSRAKRKQKALTGV